MKTKEMDHNLRYRAVADLPLCVALQREDGETPVPSGELLDISVTGIRLAVATPFRFGERFLVHLESADVGLSTKVACCVQWIRAGRSETEWTLGCTFESELEAEVLEELGERAILERRISDRQHVSMAVRAKWGRKREEEDAVLRDISSGGFCMASPHDVEIGSEVCIRLSPDEGGLCLEGSVTWCSTSDNEIIVGGKWQDRKGTDWFRQRALSAELERSAEAAQRRWRRTRWSSRMALPAVLFVLGIQIGAYQMEIGEWLELAVSQLQRFAGS